MDRLSIVLTLCVGAVVTGSLVIVTLALGGIGWGPIGAAAALGFLLSWPASLAVSRRIKRRDPAWDESAIRQTDGVPRPSDPEV